MGITSLTFCIVTLSFLVLTGYSFGFEAGSPELIIVKKPADIPGLVYRMEKAIGNDFLLDHLPQNPRTIGEAFNYLVTGSRAIIRNKLNQWSTVYGAELTVESDSQTLRVFVFSATPDFTVVFAYTVSQLGWDWPVFLSAGK